jgi:hypothetical protein
MMHFILNIYISGDTSHCLTDCAATIHMHMQQGEEDSYVTPPTSYAEVLDIYIILLTLILPLQTLAIRTDRRSTFHEDIKNISL